MYGLSCKNPNLHPIARNKFYPLLKGVNINNCGDYDNDESYSLIKD